MAENKDKLGTNPDEMEDFDFDFDADFSGDFFAEEPPPANKREAVARTLKTAGKSFAEEFDLRDPDKIEKYINSAIPSSLSTEVNTLIDLKSSILEELQKTGPEMKRNTNKLLKTINKYIPKGKISGGIDKLIGMTDSEQVSSYNNQKSREAMLEESIARMIESTEARSERAEAEQRIREEINFRKDLNQLEISNHIVANLDRLINFENTVTTNYYKKSLDLQYRLLDTAQQSLELGKLNADTSKNQLEAVIKNTSLPDVVKVRSAEVIKMLAVQNTANSAMKSLFGEGSRVDRIKQKLAGVAKQKIGNFAYGLQSANTGAEMLEGFKEQSAMMGGGAGMGATLAGSMVGDAVRNFLGELTGRALENNEKSANKIADIKEFFSDPRSWFKEKLDKSYKDNKDPSFLERKKRSFLSLMADATNNSLRDGYISVDRVDPDASAVYTNRTDRSITQTIPQLLSEILFNTAGANLTLQQYTGITPNVDKLRLDSTTGKLISEKASLNKVKSRFENEARSGGGAYSIRRATGTFLENGKMKLSEKERAELDRAMSEYLMEGGKVTSDMFRDKKLLSKLNDKKLIKRVVRADEDFRTRGSKLDRAKARTDFNNYIDSALTSIRSPEQLFSKMIREGNLDHLEELGLVKLTEDGTPIVDNKKYKELISGAFYKESLKYAENNNYKNIWDKKDELDRLSKLEAKRKADALKNGIKSGVNKTKKFAEDVRDGTVEKRLKEATENTLNKATVKIESIKDEIDKVLLTEENREKVEEAKAKIAEVKNTIENSKTSKAVKNKMVEKVNAIKDQDLLETISSVSESLKDNSKARTKDAKEFTEKILTNIKDQVGANEAKDLIKSIITVDGNGTAVIETLTDLTNKKREKDQTPEEKLEATILRLNESMEKSNELTEKELESTKLRFNDKDGNGVRDGSWKEKIGNVFRSGSKKQEEKSNKEDNKKDDKSSGMLKTILGAVFGGLTSIVGGLFSGLGGMFGGLTSLLGMVGKGIIGPLVGGLASLLPGFVKGGFKLAGGMLKGGAKGVSKFTKATKGTRGFEKKMFGNILGKVGGAALRKLPLIGLLAGGYMGVQMLRDGDTIGGLGTMASSLLAQIPGIGTALSIGLDGLLGLRDQKEKNEIDIDAELEKKKAELDERNAMMQKANENNWEKEAILLQNKFDKFNAEQDEYRRKIDELENSKFMTDSKKQLIKKEKDKLAKSEKELADAKLMQVKLDKNSADLKTLKERREKAIAFSVDERMPLETREKFKAEIKKLDGEITQKENEIAEAKKFIDSQDKKDNVINKLGDPKKRLEFAIAGRDKLIEAQKKLKEPTAIMSMQEAIDKSNRDIESIKREIENPSLTQQKNDALNVGNDKYTIERDRAVNPESYLRADGTQKSSDEIQMDLQKKMLEAKIADLENRKIKVNEEFKKKHNGKSGYGDYGATATTYNYNKGGSGGSFSTDISIADEATIAKNSHKGGNVKSIINSASQRAGIDPTLMQIMAAKESSFNPNAKAPTSSATGLYQFLDGTWRGGVNNKGERYTGVIQQYGKKYGLDLSNASRLDPEHSTLMAAEYLKSNIKQIKGVKSNPNITDAYLTHFLGPGGAKKLLSANPDDPANKHFSNDVISANAGIFIGNGRVRTIREVYDVIASQLAKTAGDFGIKVDKEDIAGSSGMKNKVPENNEIMPNNPAADIASANTSGPNSLGAPTAPIEKKNRPSNEISQTAGITGGHNNISAPVTPNTITTEDVKQSVYNNGNDKIAKDAEDRAKKAAEAQAELDKRANSYSNMQSQANSTQTFNSVNDTGFKTQLANTQALAESAVATNAKLDSIVTNTGRTVEVLMKIHDKLDNLKSGNNTAPATNQSSSVITKSPENAVSLNRGNSVK